MGDRGDGRRRVPDGGSAARPVRAGAGRRAPAQGLLPRDRLGDHPAAQGAFAEAFPASGFDATILRLFDRDVADIPAFLGEQDVVYVGGGNTVSMLAIWRAHGVDEALRVAYAAGVVLAGMSAGANCWFEACTTDSFLLGRADPLLEGLGLIPGSLTPHYDSEEARRPAVHALIGSRALPDGHACDDFAALHLVDGEVRAAVATRPEARAFRVERVGDGGHGNPLEVRQLS
jgi:dipeptidase E